MIKVSLYGKILGFISEESHHHTFEFSKEWNDSGLDISPILYGRDVPAQIRLRKNNDTFAGLPEFLSDALPDKFGNKIIDAYFLKQGIATKEISVLQRLSYLGTKAIGALEFEPAIQAADNFNYEHSLKVSKLVEDARHAINGNINDVSHDLIQIGSSAGGARPKALIAANAGFQDIRSGLVSAPKGYKHYLIKFDGVDEHHIEADPQGYTNIEYVYYQMAKLAGINMADCFLLGDSERQHFVTERFDRINNQKHHVQTLCAMTGIDFNQHQSGSYSDYFSVVNTLNLDYDSKVEAYRRMVFNVLSLNRDDHTKNFSFKLDRAGTWFLAPAYDITHAYNETNPNAWTREHNLLINGKGKDITKADLIVESSVLALSDKDIDAVHHQVQDALASWQTLSKDALVLDYKVEKIQQRINQAQRDFQS